MRAARSQLDRFVSALHRRLLVLRALEATALGAAGGCAAGAAMIPLLYWRDVPALPPTLGALLLGAATGLLWGVTRRPTRLQVAAEADRQLNLADLLGTAITVRQKARESDRDAGAQPWLGAVLTLAEDAARRHTPSEVILHRLHARAWGGIAIAAALVLTVATLTSPEPTARASSTTQARGRGPMVQQVGGNDAVAGSNGRPAPSRSQGTGPEREREGVPGATTQASGDDSDAGNPADSTRTSTANSTNGQGGGIARARNPGGNEKSPPPAGAPGFATSQKGEATGGAGPAAKRATSGSDSTGTVGGAAARAPAAPPWQSPTWSDDARAAREAVESGRVPDSRRDLVREYFSR